LFGWDDAESAQLPSRAARLAVATLALALLGLQARAIAGPYEDWPFSSAPMFARYHDASWPIYELTFYAELKPGVERPLDPRSDLGIGETAFKRLLFGDYYGSIDPRHPAGHHEHDTPELFRQRLGDFCRKLTAVLRQRTGSAPRALRLELSRVQQERDANGMLQVAGVLERRTVFAFDVPADRPFEPSRD